MRWFFYLRPSFVSCYTIENNLHMGNDKATTLFFSGSPSVNELDQLSLPASSFEDGAFVFIRAKIVEFTDLFLQVLATVAVTMVIVAGIFFIISLWNEDLRARGFAILKHVFIGIILASLSVGLVKLVVSVVDTLAQF